MTYPIIVPEQREPARHARKNRKGWQLSDLSTRLLEDIGVVRQRNGKYASAAMRQAIRRQADQGPTGVDSEAH